MRVVVQRGAGDRPAPEPIVEPLGTDPRALLERGRNFLDDAVPVAVYEVDALPRQWLGPGDVVHFEDEATGQAMRARVAACTLRATVDDAGAVTVERQVRLEVTAT